MKKLFMLFATFAMLCAVGCESLGDDNVVGGSYDINGAIQKGPFVLGTNITIQPLNDNLKPIGQMFATQTINDAGLFEMNDVNSKYAEIIATGYYFDEVIGNISSTTLTLRSIADLSDGGNVNVNLLTTITYNRVKQLVTNEEQSITDATKQAERELFLALGIPEDKHPKSRCETLDISKEGEDNGLLLAISAILQGGRTVGELSEYIARLSMDLADDGYISENLLEKLVVEGEHRFMLEDKVTNNLQTRYNDIGSDAVIPEFGQYIVYLDPQTDYVGIPFTYHGDLTPEIIAQWWYIDACESYEQIVWEYGNGLRDVNFNGINPIDVIGIYYDNKADKSGNCHGEIRLSSVPKYIRFDISVNSIVLPEGLEVIDTSCSQWCDLLQEVSLPNSLISIAHCTFQNCRSLHNIYLPDGIKHIGNQAFAGSAIGLIEIPDSVEEIGHGVFAECESLYDIFGKYSSEDNTCLIQDGCLKAVAQGRILDGMGEYAIPEGVTTIGAYSFMGCNALKGITLPQGLTTIQEFAFENCYNLASVTFPDSVTEIGGGAFLDCKSLTSINIPASVTSIESYAFYNCTSLTSVYCKATTPPAGDEYMFTYNASGRKIYVPTESVDAYKAADGWSEYADSIVGYNFQQ